MTTGTAETSSIDAIIIDALRNGKPLIGAGGVLTPLVQRAVAAALAGEMEAHLATSEAPNRRNGHSRKTVKSGLGSFEIATPRDREGTFERN